MGHIRSITFIMVILSLGMLITITSGANEIVLFDQTLLGFPGFDNQGPAGFSDLKNFLEKSGFNVMDSVSKRINFGIITDVVLKKANYYFIVNPMRVPNANEIDLLSSYVTKGGNLFLICDSPEAINNSNMIAKKYGLSFQNEQLEGVNLSFLQNSPQVNRAIPLAFGGDDTSYEWIDEYSLEPSYKKYMNSSIILNATAEHSHDLVNGTENNAGERIVLANIQEGKGSVTALGTSELFTNNRMDEGEAMVQYLFNLSKAGKKLAPEYKPALTYPKVWYVKFSGNKTNQFPITFTNNEKFPLSVSIIIPERIRDLLEPAEVSLRLEPNEMKNILYLFHDYNQKYSNIWDEIVLNVSIEGGTITALSDKKYSGTIILSAEQIV